MKDEDESFMEMINKKVRKITIQYPYAKFSSSKQTFNCVKQITLKGSKKNRDYENFDSFHVDEIKFLAAGSFGRVHSYSNV